MADVDGLHIFRRSIEFPPLTGLRGQSDPIIEHLEGKVFFLFCFLMFNHIKISPNKLEHYRFLV